MICFMFANFKIKAAKPKMTDEITKRNAMQAYIDEFNAQNLAGIVALYAEDATIEDPVGSPVISGRQAITAFYETALQTGARLRLSAPIRTSHSDAAAMAFEVALELPQGATVIHVIDVMTFDPAGEFTSMKAYWGPGDMRPGDIS